MMPQGDTVSMDDELEDMVPNDAGSPSRRSTCLLRVATSVGRFELTLLRDMRLGPVVRDAAWLNADEPGRKGKCGH